MTVISAVITRSCTVHASDSLITKRTQGGTYKPGEWERSKIIAVQRWRGAMSYWGLAKHPGHNWSTPDWLEEQVESAGEDSGPEEFAQRITERLAEAISNMHFTNQIDAGIGIHFTAYEYISSYWIPELFLISNWVDPTYRSLRPTGVGLSRETYHTIADVPASPEHRGPEYRLEVQRYLHQRGGMIVYNNGDPGMFNVAAKAIFEMVRQLGQRGKLTNPQHVETYLAIARRPIEIISAAQRDFCREGTRVVGGKPHDLAVTPGGAYSSTTGEKY
jgi:hypothetical protein